MSAKLRTVVLNAIVADRHTDDYDGCTDGTTVKEILGNAILTNIMDIAEGLKKAKNKQVINDALHTRCSRELGRAARPYVRYLTKREWEILEEIEGYEFAQYIEPASRGTTRKKRSSRRRS